MENNYFTIKKLEVLIENRINLDNIEYLDEIKAELLQIFQHSLRSFKEWTFEHFLALTGGFLFNPWCEKYTTSDPAKINGIETYIEIYDPKKALNDIIQYFYTELKKISRKEIENEVITASTLKTPAKWLYIASKNISSDRIDRCYQEIPDIFDGEISFFKHIRGICINGVMRKLITYHHFGIDEKKAEEGMKRGTLYDIEQTAEFLTKHLGKEIKKHQVLDYCLESDVINVYIKKREYANKNRVYDSAQFCIRSIQEIEKALINGQVTRSYLYPFEGLIRLAKYSDLGQFDNQTVKHLNEVGTISTYQVTPRCNFLYVEIPLSEYILNHSSPIQISEQHQITLDNIFFLEHELEIFLKNQETDIFQVLEEILKESMDILPYPEKNKIKHLETLNAMEGRRYMYENGGIKIYLIDELIKAADDKNHKLFKVVEKYQNGSIDEAVKKLYITLIDSRNDEKLSMYYYSWFQFPNLLEKMKKIDNLSSTLRLGMLKKSEYVSNKIFEKRESKENNSHELLEIIIVKIQEQSNSLKLADRGGPRRLWDRLNDFGIGVSTEAWIKGDEAKLSYFSPKRNEKATITRKYFQNLMPKLKKMIHSEN
jgi:hypothetical protein